MNKPIDLINIPIPPPIDDGIDQPPPPKPLRMFPSRQNNWMY